MSTTAVKTLKLATYFNIHYCYANDEYQLNQTDRYLTCYPISFFSGQKASTAQPLTTRPQMHTFLRNCKIFLRFLQQNRAYFTGKRLCNVKTKRLN